MATKKYMEFKEASDFVGMLGLNGEKQWRIYCRRGGRPKNIPSAPSRVYKDKGWTNWGNWLGSGRVKNGEIEYLPFYDAWEKIYPFILEKGIDTQKKWYKNYKSIFPINFDVPASASYYYKNSGWISWEHWLRAENRVAKRKHRLNEDFFKVWTNEMAYILGFWWADGNIFKNTFSICQHKKDRYILEQFLEKMAYSGKLREYHDCLILEVYSKKIVKSIVDLGGKERKSLDIGFPNIPEKYLNDFIRGYFDGDGHIGYDKKNQRYYMSFVSGSESLILSVHERLKRAIPMIRGSVHKENDRCFRLYFSSHDVIRIGEYLYADKSCLMLKRKFEKVILAKRKYKNGNPSND